jgi:transglutaminase-like putative cysteine protease
MNSRFLGKLSTAEALGFLLVLTGLQTFTYGVSESLRNPNTKYLFTVCFIAVWIGLGLGKRNSNPIQAAAGIAALGVAGVWIIGARLAIPILDLARAVVVAIPLIIPAVQSKTMFDTSSIVSAWGVIIDASGGLASRWQIWLAGLARNISVNDVLVRNMLWLILFWLVAAWAGWFTARRNAVITFLPALVLLAAVTSYSEHGIETIWMLVLVMLLLMGVWNYKNHTQQWESRKVDYSDSIRYDNTLAVFFLAITMGSLAFITPSISWREVRDYFREREQASQSEAADMLGIQEPQVSSKTGSAPRPALPRQHLLSGGYAHSQKIVMTIRTGELPPMMETGLAANAPRYYWRSVIYDKYIGAGWVTSPAPSQKYSANTPLIPGLLNNYKLIHLDVDIQQPEGKLFWSGMLFSADIPLRVDWRARPPSDLFADRSALLQADIFLAATKATAYKANSYLPIVSIGQLRSAPSDYPDAIRKHYLALPHSVPERVLALAQEITAGKPNPYDQAKAIETYLRANYPYDLEVPAPPPDTDVADYFLFDLKKGYCDYYATAMVVLARASGIPARFVTGYSPGAYDAPAAQYIIRELNAHSWAEVYFAQIGWVEFEPTGSIPEIERSGTGSRIPPEQTPDSTASDLLTRFRLERAIYLLLPLLIVIALAWLYFAVIEKWWYLRLAPAGAITRIYHKFYRAGRPFAGAHTPAETSQEFVIRLKRRLGEEGRASRFNHLFDQIQNKADSLTNAYHNALFRDQQMHREDSRITLQTWKILRWQILLARLITMKKIKMDSLKMRM